MGGAVIGHPVKDYTWFGFWPHVQYLSVLQRCPPLNPNRQIIKCYLRISVYSMVHLKNHNKILKKAVENYMYRCSCLECCSKTNYSQIT